MKVILTGGGTGGHIYPAIAIADMIKKEDENAQILFIGTEQGLESELVPQNGYDIKFITVSGFNRHNLLKNISVIGKAIKGSNEAKKIITTFFDMIKLNETDDEKLMEILGDAYAFKNISYMPSRVKCAFLSWKTLEKILEELN